MSPLRCSSLNRKGRPCGKLGHNLGADGRRWCRSHLPEVGGTTKSPIRCEGRLANGDQCGNMAEQLVTLERDGEPVDTPLCVYHARVSTDGPARANGGAELDEDEEELLGSLRWQLNAAGSEFSPLIIATLRKMLKSSNPTANAQAVRILLDRLAPVDGPAQEEEPLEGDVTKMSTRQLRAALHATPESWGREWHRDRNFGSKVEHLVSVDRRVGEGKYVDAEELAEAKAEAAHIRRWREQTQAVETLTFEARPG